MFKIVSREMEGVPRDPQGSLNVSKMLEYSRMLKESVKCLSRKFQKKF